MKIEFGVELMLQSLGGGRWGLTREPASITYFLGGQSRGRSGLWLAV